MILSKASTCWTRLLFGQQWKQAYRWGALSTSCKHTPTEDMVRCRLLDEQNRKKMMEQILKFQTMVSAPDPSKNMIQAAVFIPFCIVDGRFSVLLTRRSSRLATYIGHVSFPGGRIDQTDKSTVDAVLRETNEELGIPTSHMDVWLECAPFADRIGKTLVTPVIGYLGEFDVSTLKPNYDEVSNVFSVPFLHLLSPENQRYTLYRDGLLMPVFTNCQFPIWGMTASILDAFMAIVFPDVHKLITRQKEGSVFLKHKNMIDGFM